MKVALFGASGFIGSNLAARLDARPDVELRLCDLDDSKLRLSFENKPYPFELVDIGRNADLTEEMVDWADVVFDLAAYVYPAMFLRRPLDVVQLNLFDCLNVVRACVRHHTRLIHFSTSEVYGKTGGSDAPFREDETDLILGPIGNHRWIYSCAKQLMDRIIHAHGLQDGLTYTLVRPFNFVGPLMDQYVREWNAETNPRVFANFMSALVYGRPLQLVDGGRNRRCFTYIEDAVSALETILDHPAETRQQVINIGNPANETSIAALAEKIVQLYVTEFDPAARPVITTVPAAEFYGPGYEDCDRRMPDISKLAALGWAPRYDLDATLRAAMGYWVGNRERLVAALGD